MQLELCIRWSWIQISSIHRHIQSAVLPRPGFICGSQLMHERSYIYKSQQNVTQGRGSPLRGLWFPLACSSVSKTTVVPVLVWGGVLTVGGGGPPEWTALSPPRPCHMDSTYERRSFHYKWDSETVRQLDTRERSWVESWRKLVTLDEYGMKLSIIHEFRHHGLTNEIAETSPNTNSIEDLCMSNH